MAIIGPNGCGKSTLMKTIFGLLKPTKGLVTFSDTDITGMPPHEIVRRGLSYVPQADNTFLSLTVQENLAMGAFLRPDIYAEQATMAYDLFPDLKERRNAKVSSLSGGQRQMVAMARALMLEPQLLLLDEPTAGLAPVFVETVFAQIAHVNAQGIAVLMVEQNARMALEHTHRGYVLAGGENRFTDESSALLANEEVARLYLRRGGMIALIVDGIILGSILSLGAVSLTLVYGIVRFANFAHGDLMAVGAYVAFFLVNTVFAALGVPTFTFGPLSFGLPMLLALPLAMLATAGVAVIVDRLVFRPMRQRRYATVMFVIGSLAVAFALRALLFIIWGPEFHFFTQALRPALQLPFEVRVKPDQIFILIACLAMVVGLYLFLKHSKIGQALRATADNPDLARLSGINTERMMVWTWAIGAAMAATAGILLGIDSQLRPEMGWNLLLPLFAAAILGGIGNPYGALIGGMVIGIVQQVSTAFLLPTYKPAVAFVILILVLLIRPRGILGSEQRGF